MEQERPQHTTWASFFFLQIYKIQMGQLEASGRNMSPGDLIGEQKRVGFKGHGAVGGGRSFGEDQIDQRVESAVPRRGVSTSQQPGGEAQQAGEEELRADAVHKREGTGNTREHSGNQWKPTCSNWFMVNISLVNSRIRSCCSVLPNIW